MPNENTMPNPSNSPDLSSGQFSVTSPSVPSTPVPAANGMNTQELASANQAMNTRSGAALQAQATQQGDQMIAASGGRGGGGSEAGSILGSIGRVASMVLPFILNQGGPVGYAEGGATEDVPYIEPPAAPQPSTTEKQGQHSPENIFGMGYLVGALHQAKYGGTPDTLTDAAKEIKMKLGQPMQETQLEPPQAAGMAGGGVADNVQLAQSALMKAMGLNSDSGGDQAMQPQQATGGPVPTNTANMMQPQQQPQAPPTTPIQSRSAQLPYSRGYADGGPPLQPGQAFEGDGKVAGPGTSNSDSIPAKLSDGEFVFAAPAVQFYGVDKLVKLNEQGKAGFMQAMQQVQQNQPQQGAQPQAPGAPVAPPGQGMMQPLPPASPQQQPPMAQADGGVTARKNTGYMGL